MLYASRMCPDPTGLWVAALAKINLTLEVLGRRPDGYHDLRSVVVPLALADRVELQPAPDDTLTLEVVSAGVPISGIGPCERNLAWRAAQLLRAHCQIRAGVALRVLKRIPLGGGLGGGSADAAAVLVGLARLWKLELGPAELAELGAGLGSDVPAQVLGRAVLMEGRGERVTPLDGLTVAGAAGFHVVLANPGTSVSTADVYRSCGGALTSEPNNTNNMISSVRNGDVQAAATWLFNGLEAGVYARYPETGRLAGCLRAAGALGVLLCGSGATVLGLVADAAQGARVQAALPGDVWSLLTRTLPDGVMAAHGPLEP